MNANRSTVSASGGVGVLGLLGAAFVVLKLCGVVSWGWNIVLAPFWVPAAAALLAAFIAMAAFAVIRLGDRTRQKRRRM